MEVQIYFALGEREEALELLEIHFQRVNTDIPKYKKFLVETYFALGDLDNAEKEINFCIEDIKSKLGNKDPYLFEMIMKKVQLLLL